MSSKTDVLTKGAILTGSRGRGIPDSDYESSNILNEVVSLVKDNAASYMMYFALIVIMLVFQVWTEGKFFTAQNISNLFNQAAYVAVLAIGMTIILILRHIDLSCGYVAGLSGAVAAILMEKMGMNVWMSMFIVLAMGLAIGLYQGALVTKIGIPAFITTLAGMFIFRGLLTRSLAGTGTIIVTDPTFKAMCQGFIPDFPNNNTGVHIVTMIIAVIAVVIFNAFKIRSRMNREKYGFPVASLPIFIAGKVVVSAVILFAAWMLAINKGIPISACIVAVILGAYAFMLSKTKLGRHIYGIGGNDQAAELSGVDVKKVTMFAFCSMSVLAAIAGFLYTSRLSSATPTAGLAFEMDAIASSYIGGTAVSGGVGKVTNAIIGTFVIMSLTNGMNLMSIDISYQYIVKGIIFIIAVAFDVKSKKK
ncbi:MAG: sugar ABC transporter permease [Clostridiales bacterium]|nr:sugar ABC transporter permease [Clostridiales bacterium]